MSRDKKLPPHFHLSFINKNLKFRKLNLPKNRLGYLVTYGDSLYSEALELKITFGYVFVGLANFEADDSQRIS